MMRKPIGHDRINQTTFDDFFELDDFIEDGGCAASLNADVNERDTRFLLEESVASQSHQGESRRGRRGGRSIENAIRVSDEDETISRVSVCSRSRPGVYNTGRLTDERNVSWDQDTFNCRIPGSSLEGRIFVAIGTLRHTTAESRSHGAKCELTPTSRRPVAGLNRGRNRMPHWERSLFC